MKKMDDLLAKQRERLGAPQKDGVKNAYIDNTANYVNTTFNNSPSHKKVRVFIKGEEPREEDAHILDIGRMGNIRECIFRPFVDIPLGTYLEFSDIKWLSFDRYDNHITPKHTVAQCNRKLKFKKYGKVYEVDVFATATDIGSKSKQSRNEVDWNKYDVRMPIGQMFLYMQTNEISELIQIDDRFIVSGRAWKVSGFDNVTLTDREGVGVTFITLKNELLREGDDLENGIASSGIMDNEGNDLKEDEVEEGELLW